jgi:DNA topoisomerase VI subunit B
MRGVAWCGAERCSVSEWGETSERASKRRASIMRYSNGVPLASERAEGGVALGVCSVELDS